MHTCVHNGTCVYMHGTHIFLCVYVSRNLNVFVYLWASTMSVNLCTYVQGYVCVSCESLFIYVYGGIWWSVCVFVCTECVSEGWRRDGNGSCLTTWSSVGTIWKGLGSVASLEEVCYWGQALRFQKAPATPISPPSALLFVDQVVNSQLVLLPYLCQSNRSNSDQNHIHVIHSFIYSLNKI